MGEHSDAERRGAGASAARIGHHAQRRGRNRPARSAALYGDLRRRAGSAGRTPGDVVITQTGPAAIEVDAAGERYDVQVEFFRAENRYVSRESLVFEAELETVD